jgi:hypothetical protein
MEDHFDSIHAMLTDNEARLDRLEEKAHRLADMMDPPPSPDPLPRLGYAVLAVEREQDQEADPGWRSPRHLGLPHRVPGEARS